MQAEYQLPVKHPLFLYWVQDPVSELDSLKLSGEDIRHTCLYLLCFIVHNMKYEYD